MRTEELITVLVADLSGRRVSLRRGFALAAGLGVALAFGLFLVSLGPRDDFLEALGTWRFLAKFAVTTGLAAAAGLAALRFARPCAAGRTAAVLLVPLLILLFAVACEVLTVPPETWMLRAIGRNAAVCLVAIPSLSAAPLIILLAALRAGAPRSPALEGAFAGLLAGAIAAVFYAAKCTDDSPFFVALWYTLALVPPVLAGAFAGARVLRW